MGDSEAFIALEAGSKGEWCDRHDVGAEFQVWCDGVRATRVPNSIAESDVGGVVTIDRCGEAMNGWGGCYGITCVGSGIGLFD